MTKMRTLTNWGANGLVALLVLLAAFFVISSVLLGWRFNPVMSGSMDPTFKAGDIVASHPVDPKTIEVGDIITYRSPELGKVVVHRVTEKHEGSQLYFQTKGDANGHADPSPVPSENVVGKVTLDIPFLGYVQQFATSASGKLLLFSIPGLFIMGKGIKNIHIEISRLRNRREATVPVNACTATQGWATGLGTEDWLTSQAAGETYRLTSNVELTSIGGQNEERYHITISG